MDIRQVIRIRQYLTLARKTTPLVAHTFSPHNRAMQPICAGAPKRLTRHGKAGGRSQSTLMASHRTQERVPTSQVTVGRAPQSQHHSVGGMPLSQTLLVCSRRHARLDSLKPRSLNDKLDCGHTPQELISRDVEGQVADIADVDRTGELLIWFFTGLFAKKSKAKESGLDWGAERGPDQKLEASNSTSGRVTETIILGGGCFWCTEACMRMLKGVTSVTSGYLGPETSSAPTYEQVCTGLSEFVEVVEVDYDPSVLSFTDVLKYVVAGGSLRLSGTRMSSTRFMSQSSH
eukprot:gene1769-33185_t